MYDSLVQDVVAAANPLNLFERRHLRHGMSFIEALYRVHADHAERGDMQMRSSLAPLGYSRWIAWRRFDEAVRSGTVQRVKGLRGHLLNSRAAVIEHVRGGWLPNFDEGDDGDEELQVLLGEY